VVTTTMNKNITLILDFDSTFIEGESLDLLAEIALEGKRNKMEVLAEVRRLTREGMEGNMSYVEVLEKRLGLFHAHKHHIAILVANLKQSVTPSIIRHTAFFRKHAGQIYILSGGFREYIEPVVSDFGIAKDHILANTFTFDDKGMVTGYDTANPLAREKGKVVMLKQMHLSGDVYLIGDGYTDYEAKESHLVKAFFAFTENVWRETVIEKADRVVGSFEEVLEIVETLQCNVFT